jgi:uncharacterized repeat protein (TIGR01451 family)
MSIAEIPAGGSLVFTVSALVTQTGGTAVTLTNTMGADYSGDIDRSNNSATVAATGYTAHADVSVSGSGPANGVQPGDPISFTMTLVNPGPDAASTVQIIDNLSGNLTYVGITCQAVGDVQCPTALGPVMSVASMPAQSSLVFTVNASVPFSTSNGTVTNTMSVTTDSNDTTRSDNSIVVSSSVGSSSSSGTYKLYAADGNVYDMSIDFSSKSYTVSLNGQTVLQRSFADKNDAGDYVVSANARLRVATDLIVGSDDFGHGVIPYIAARRFVTSVEQVGGAFDLATRDIATDGTATTHAATAQITSNLIQICQSDTSDTVYRVQECATSGDGAKSYSMTVSGDEFTATDISSGEQFKFRFALSGGATILLANSTGTDGSRELRIGLRDGAALAGGTQYGGTTDGDWVSTVLSNDDFTMTLSDGTTVEGVPEAVSSGAIYSMRYIQVGLQADFQYLYVLQEFPITVVVGDYGTPASGLLQIELP